MRYKSHKSYGVIVNLNGKNVIKNVVKVGDVLPHKFTMPFKIANILQNKITLELYEGTSCNEIDNICPIWNVEEGICISDGNRQKYCGYLEFPVNNTQVNNYWDVTFYINESGFLYTTCEENMTKNSQRVSKDEKQVNDNYQSVQNKKRNIYGVDLGTTYSCIAKLDVNGYPEVIPNYVDGTYTLASVVFFEKDSGNALFGESAKEYMETSPERLIQFVKREIGKPNEKTYSIDGQEYTAIEISALILRKLIQMAEEQGENVTDVVITYPAYFGYEEKEATRIAAELAGMNVKAMINETTAAVMSYFYRQFPKNQTVVVYHLGGATFDVAIVKTDIINAENGVPRDQVEYLANEGDDYLGGKEWDNILYNILVGKYCEEMGMSDSELDVVTRQTIRSKVEKTKKNLSVMNSVKVKIRSDAGPINIVVTREEFEEATSYLVAKT